MTGTNCLYFYGIIHNYYSPEQFYELKETGLEVVSYEKISAIVAKRRYTDLTHSSKETLARLLIEHQKVLEQVMNLGFAILIPMKLGTWSKDQSEVYKILEKGYSLCMEILGKVGNMVEVDVAVTWKYFDRLIQAVADDPEITEFKKELMAKEQVSVADQMQIGKMIREKLNKKSESARTGIIKHLEPVCQELREHELMDDQMIANVAFLVNKGKISLFEEALDQLDQDFQGRLNFKYVGPLPCYSFYTLEVVELNFREIEQARNVLGLNIKASAWEIRQAYHTKVKSAHPDVHSGEKDEVDFTTLSKAYHIMSDYMKTFGKLSDEDSFCFSEEKVTENSLLVKIRE